MDQRSELNLKSVHPDLVRVIRRAREMGGRFIVIEGARTLARQGQLVQAGASQTLNSRHLIASNGYAHAVDLAATIGGKIRWDWPLYHVLAGIVKRAALVEAVPIEWGGDWKKFKDGPHFQLPFAQYPK